MRNTQTKERTAEGIGPRRGSKMLVSILIMAVLAVGLTAFAYFRGHGEHLEGLKRAKDTVIEVFPLLILAYIVAGMVQALLPREAVSEYLGKGSGLRGIVIACFAGGVTPGGPLISLPVAKGLLSAGAGLGTTVAYLTAWSLWAAGRVPLEIGFMGLQFTVIRVICTGFFPPIAGLIARSLFERS